MKKKSLDLSKNIDERHRKTFSEVTVVAERLGIPFVVVGAMARDLILHYEYGAPISRATDDIDFGLQVSTWGDYDRLKAELCKGGYKEDKQVQRLIDPRNRVVDLVPFGAIQDAEANIEYPPNGDFKMSVLGFQEALDNAIRAKIQDEPNTEISVVSPPGLALLKIIAWSDREANKRDKDSSDFGYLLEAYERVSDISDRAYDVEGLMESVYWDIRQASAYLLGIDSAAIAQPETDTVITEILTKELSNDDGSHLISGMCKVNSETEYTHKQALLKSFNRGFTEQ